MMIKLSFRIVLFLKYENREILVLFIRIKQNRSNVNDEIFSRSSNTHEYTVGCAMQFVVSNMKECSTTMSLHSLSLDAIKYLLCYKEKEREREEGREETVHAYEKRERENRYVSVNNDDGHSNTNILSLLFDSSQSSTILP